jgi:hypothetical protein
VEITTATDGDTLTYDDNDSKWKNKQFTLAGLTDVNISGIQDGEVLTYDTNGWVNDTPSVPDLEDLGDVEITTATDGDTLTYDDNDSKWKNKQ